MSVIDVQMHSETGAQNCLAECPHPGHCAQFRMHHKTGLKTWLELEHIRTEYENRTLMHPNISPSRNAANACREPLQSRHTGRTEHFGRFGFCSGVRHLNPTR